MFSQAFSELRDQGGSDVYIEAIDELLSMTIAQLSVLNRSLESDTGPQDISKSISWASFRLSAGQAKAGLRFCRRQRSGLAVPSPVPMIR